MADSPVITFDTRYVNLDRRPDRLKHIRSELKRVGIENATRQPGFLPSDYRGDPDAIRGMTDRPQKGAIGCHFSQRAIVETAARMERTTLLLEDDAVFCNDFWDRWQAISNFLADHPWDVFSLGATFHVNPPYWHVDTLGRDVECTHDPHIMRTYGIWSTYAWVINGTSAAGLLKLIDANVRDSWGIDHLMIKLQPQLNCYCYVPGCCKQMDDRSNIGVHKDGSPAITKFSGFAKLGPYWFAPRSADFDPTTFDWAEAKL